MRELNTNCNNKCPFYSADTCLKPDGLFCPDIILNQFPHNERSIIVKEDYSSYLTKRCAICENDIEVNSPEIICDECKEAIKKLKEMLNNGK